MPHHSTRRPSRRDDPPMPKIVGYTVSTSYSASYGAHRGHSRCHDDSRRHHTQGDSRSRGSRHVPSRSPCCSADSPHSRRDLVRGDLAYHYFEKTPSEIPLCCSAGNPHPICDLDREELAYHHFEKIYSKIPPPREADYDHDHPRQGSGDFPFGTTGARSPRYRESRYKSDHPADTDSYQKETYSSDRHQDSSRYSQSQRSEHHPRRASSTRGPSHTSYSFGEPKASESRRESASGSKSSGSSKPRESTFRAYPEPESKARNSQSHHYDHDEHDSKYGSSQNRHHDREEHDSKYESSRSHHDDRDEHDSKYQSHHYSDGSRKDSFYEDRFREYERRKTPAPPPQPAAPFPDHYKTLGISSRASADEIKKAARSMRVSTHPDKLNKPGMSESGLKKIDARAALVGQAADVLLDKDLKKKYDLERAARKV